MKKSAPGIIVFLSLFPLLTFGASSTRLISETPTLVEFEFRFDSLDITTGMTSINLPDADRIAQPGAPDLPGKIVLIGVPQEGEVRLRYSVSRTNRWTGVEIQPMPALSETPVTPGAMFEKDEYWPSAPAELLSIETVRNIRVARIQLNPIQYNPVRKTVLIHQQLNCQLIFSHPARQNVKPDPLDSVLTRMLLNGGTAIHWKTFGPEKDSFNFFNRFPAWCQVKTETTGIYRITPDDLKNAGFDPATIDPRTFRLFTIGPYTLNGPYPDTMVEVAIDVLGAEDGRFDSRDYILFYARAPSYWNDSLSEWHTNYYTRYRVFWLTWGLGQGKRITQVPVANPVWSALPLPCSCPVLS